MLQEVKENTIEVNGKIQSLNKEIEFLKKEPNGKI